MTLYPRHGAEDHGSAGAAMSNGSSMSHSSMSHTMMAMVFQTEMRTPLFSDDWTPQTSGAYAGTCIFLVVLAILARCLLALKSIQENRWRDAAAQRRYVTANGKEPLAEHISNSPDAKRMTLSENGVEEAVMVLERKGRVTPPWRFSVDPLRAIMDVVLAGVGYLLMLAVMTMNVGYFMSVLAGIFVGSLAVGRFAAESAHH